MLGRAKSDAEWESRLERLEQAFLDARAVLNFAVSARALEGDREVPVERVWPRAVARLRAGMERGAFDVVSHGYLHLDPNELAAGRVEPREFARMPYAEAAQKLDAALEWMPGALGTAPSTFVAPNWAYGDGILEA
jgi:predicted deacetylase